MGGIAAPICQYWRCLTNLANNLFASSCDNQRPIIPFGTCLLCLSIKLMTFTRLGNNRDLIVVTVTEPVEGHVVSFDQLA